MSAPPLATGFRIVDAEPQHATSMAAIHKQAYHTDHFSSCLPQKCLERFYESQLNLNQHCLSAINDHGLVVGFIVAGFHTAEATKAFTSANRLAIVASLLTHPQFIAEKLRQVLAGWKKQPKTAVVSEAKLRLLSIAVCPDHQGCGIAGQLIEHLSDRLRQEGIASYGLSARSSNTHAIALYERQGFLRECETANGTVYFRMELAADDNERARPNTK